MKKIDPIFRAFYVEAMLYSSELAIHSINYTKTLLNVVFENSPDDPLGALPTKPFLNELQNFVLHAASLSKFLWPIRKDHQWRGADLRNILNIDDSSTLSSRNLRNAIEHFDERLDSFLARDISGYIIPHYVGFSAAAKGVPNHFFRGYYIDTKVFVLLGEQYPIDDLTDEVIKLHKKLRSTSI